MLMWRQDVQNIVLAEFSPAAGTANLEALLKIAIFQRYHGENHGENMGKPWENMIKPGRSSNQMDHLFAIANC
jgi:hypothetical protein